MEDAADAAKREERARKKARDALVESCSEAFRRGLPRLKSLTSNPFISRFPLNPGSEEIEKMISEEVSQIVGFELHHFPEESSASSAVDVDADKFAEVTPEDIKAASALVDAELQASARPTILLDFGDDEDGENAFLFNATKKKWMKKSEMTEEERIEASKEAFAKAKEMFDSEFAKASKLEKRIVVHHAGYQQRATTLCSSIEAAHAQLEHTEEELKHFNKIRDSERRAINQRIREAEAKLHKQLAVEDLLQAHFAQLKETLEHLQKKK